MQRRGAGGQGTCRGSGPARGYKESDTTGPRTGRSPFTVPMRSGKYTAFDRVVLPNDAHAIIIRLVRGE